MEAVITLLNNTVIGTPEQITAATSQLDAAKETEFKPLMLALSLVLENETTAPVAPPAARIQAGLFIKNNVSGKSQQFRDRNAEKWFSLSPEDRKVVKGRVLNTLATADRGVGSSAAQALAAIALLEVPRGEWPDLMDKLCSACDLKNPDGLKDNALKTLSYICEGVDEAQIVDGIPKILDAIQNCMGSANPSVAKAAMEALQSMVDFLNSVFVVKEKRDALMTRIFQICAKPCDEEMMVAVLSILCDIISEYYPMVNDYMGAVAQLTIPMIQKCKDEDDCVKKAIEVWMTVAEIEAEKAQDEDDALKSGRPINEATKSRKYIEGNLTTILTALFAPLTCQDPDADDDEWNVSHAAATCVSYIAECVKEKIIPPVLNMFTSSIQKSDWRIRDAATIIWGSILAGPPTEALAPYLSDASLLKMFLDHMKDPSDVVRCSTAWTLGRMCELHVDLVVTADKSRFDAIYEAFKNGLLDTPRVATMCTWGIVVLAESLDEFIKRSSVKAANPLSGHFSELVDVLFKSGEKRECPPRQRKGTYQALSALVHCSSEECFEHVAKVTVMCLDRLEMMIRVEAPANKRDADELESFVSGLMSECVQKLESRIAAIADRIFNTLVNLYKKGHGALSQEEAVLGLGYFTAAMGPNSLKYARTVTDIIKECLSKPEEVDICRVALVVVGDLSRSLDDKFGPYATEFIPLLSQLLRPQCDRRIFAPVFVAFGDIAQSSTKELAPYVSQIVGVAQQAMGSKVDLSDEDDLDFLFELQDACFVCIAGIVTGLNNLNAASSILQFSGNITQCIKLAYANMNRPEDLSRAIVGAICDLVIAAGPRTREAMAPGMPWADFLEMIKSISMNAKEEITMETCKSAVAWIQENTK